MTANHRDDVVIINMGLDALLESVRHTETWWRARSDSTGLRRTQELGAAILATRRKFFDATNNLDAQIAEARIVAEGLREAAKHCAEGQAALHARLIRAADVIERLCRSQEVSP